MTQTVCLTRVVYSPKKTPVLLQILCAEVFHGSISVSIHTAFSMSTKRMPQNPSPAKRISHNMDDPRVFQFYSKLYLAILFHKISIVMVVF